MSNTSWIERYVMPAALRIAGQKHVLSVRDGIILNMPFMLIGSFFLIFAYLPIPGYADMMSSLFGEVWRDKMLYPVKATYDIMALISSFGIAYRLAEKYRTLDPLSAGAMSLVAFMMTIPQNTLFTPVHGAAEVIKGVIPVSMVGSGAVCRHCHFAAVDGDLSFGRQPQSRYPHAGRRAAGSGEIIPRPDPRLLRAGGGAGAAPGGRGLAVRRHQQHDRHFDRYSDASRRRYAAGHDYFSHFDWYFVDHRPARRRDRTGVYPAGMAVEYVREPDGLPERSADPAYHYSAVLRSVDCPGGTGALLGLVIFMLLRSRSQQMKQLGKIAAPGALFNISEPMVFGIPLVMNPYFFLPFILTPVLLVIVSYTAMATGLVAPPAGIALPFTTPIFISGYLATGGHISGTVLQVVNLAISLVVYYPFFRARIG